MGIIVSKVCFAELTDRTHKRYDKKTAQIICRSIIIALGEDERWLPTNGNRATELELRYKFKIPEGEFAKQTLAEGIILKRENGLLFQHTASTSSVLRGWHGAVVSNLVKEGIKTDSSLTNYVFEIGQYIIKNNTPNPKKFTGKKKY